MAELLLSEFLITMPFHVFAYLPFLGHLRVSRRVLPWILLGIEAFNLLAVLLMMELGAPISYANLISIPLSVVFFFSMVRMDRGKVAFVYIFTTAYTMMVKGIANYLMPRLFPHIDPPGSWQVGVLVLAVFLLTLPFMLRYIKKTAQVVFETEAPEVWKTIWLLPLFNCALVLLLTHESQEISELYALLARLLLMGSMFLVYHNVITAVQSFQKQAADEERIRSLEQISAMQENQYAMLKERIEETRRARHDLRHHISAIQECVKSRDFGALERYMAQYEESLPASLEESRSFCKNYAVNSILCFYAEKAMGTVDMTVSVQMGEETVIPEPELCVMLGNLLENALEACAGQREGGFIRVHIQQNGPSTLILTVDNTCAQPPAWEKGRLRSSKREGFGVGMESVRQTAMRYNGDARFQWRDGVFYASVMLNP